MKNKNVYITTTLPYINSKPHVGHCLEFVQADALSRFFKNQGCVVFLNMGVDEHGVKVWDKAQEFKVDTQIYCDGMVHNSWKPFCALLEINYDNFYRTTSLDHKEAVTDIWLNLLNKGLIYKKPYSGKYCSGCESFKTDKEIVDGHCTEHLNIELTNVEEENFFFKLSFFKDRLIEWFRNNPDFLQPASKTEELANIILGVEDISISRLKKNVPWGIDVPNEPDHVMYVWFEALMNYILAVATDPKNDLMLSNSNYRTDGKFWPPIQVCGPDNLKFQGCIFQAFLLALNLNNTKKLLVHGTVLDDKGRKMSKSVGNVVDPIDQVDKYGVDAVRYYILSGLSTYGNATWSEHDLIEIYNSELADDFGNLYSRVLHLVELRKLKFEGLEDRNIDAGFKEIIKEKETKAIGLWNKFEIQLAVKETNLILKFGNKYINNVEPWKTKEYNTPLYNLLYLLEVCNNLLSPVIPQGSTIIANGLAASKKLIPFKKLEKLEKTTV